VINIASTPSLTAWTGASSRPYGNFNAGDLRATASGPVIADKLAAGIGAGFSRRDGFTKNDVTGHDLDSRSAAFAKGQLLWRPDARWEARAIVTAERARDGDYALNDLAALRANPFHSSRSIEGFTHRDIIAPTLQVARTARGGFLGGDRLLSGRRRSHRSDYTALPLVTRSNAGEDFQFARKSASPPRRRRPSRCRASP
jgi:iron complex outermembrane receptor protein